MKKELIARASLIIMLLFNAGCQTTAPIITPEINDASNSIEEALSLLEGESADWQQILRNLETKVQTALKVDVQNILDRGIASMGEQANCLIDIRTQQIKRELQNLLSRIRGEQAQPITPIICLPTPPNIQMALLLPDPAFSRTIYLSGYDLDKGQYHIYLEKSEFNIRTFRTSIVRENISNSHLNIQTHYHAVFNYSDISLNVNCRKFLIYHNTTLLTEISIEQKHCPSQIATTDKKTVSVTNFKRDHCDKDFGDKNAKFKVDISLSISSDRQKVFAEIKVSVNEIGEIFDESKRTKGSKNISSVQMFTNTLSGYEIRSITTSTTFKEDGFTNTSENSETKNYSGLIHHIDYYGRAWGFDDLDKAKINIMFDKINVVLRETGTCIN